MSNGAWLGGAYGLLFGGIAAWFVESRREQLAVGVASALTGAIVGHFRAAGSSSAHAPPEPGSEPPAPPSTALCPPEGARVLLIGDSYSVGFGPQLADFAALCKTPYHHHGVVGASVTQWDRDEWLNPQLAAIQPNVVLISLGGNDFQRNDPAHVAQRIDNLLARIKAAGARPLWVAPPTTPFPDKIGVRSMWQQRMGADGFPSDQLDIPRVPTDPLGHPNGAGYQKWAAAIWPWASGRLLS